MDLLLKPNISDLTRLETISLAQKKANNFIRKNNWFCDPIELDKNNIMGEQQVINWTSTLKKTSFKTQKFSLVLAPKSNEWRYREGVWKPIEDAKLRVLADVSYRDQTFGIAALMTLANIVETFQGPSFLPGLEAKKYGVKSYGNRLLCHWVNENEVFKANFSLGSNQLYKKYFDDFESFMERPTAICDLNVSLGVNDEDLVILSFDIKDFFNNIDIDVLLEKVKYLLNKSQETDVGYDDYLSKLKKILTFEVNGVKKTNKAILDLLDDYTVGLPQGYAASGFFSNVYMLDFDNEIEEVLGKAFLEDFEIIDYVRYVDDIRIVVKKKKKINMKKISELVGEEINKYFLNYGNKVNNLKALKINPDKTDFTTYKNYKNISNGHKNLRAIQTKLSSAPDYETLGEILNSLENIIEISKLSSKKNFEKDFSVFNIDFNKNHFEDIKAESIQKFAGYRLYKSVLLKHKLIDNQGEENLSLKLYEKRVMDERKKYVEKLVNLFLKNPSLFQFLRYSLDLIPDRNLVKKIFDILNSVDKNNKKDVYISYFVKMDIFMASITSIGYSKKNDYDPIILQEFRKEIVTLAIETLNNKEIPTYLKNSAVLTILSFNNSMSLCNKNWMLEGNIKNLVEITLNEDIKSEKKKDYFVYYLLNYQLNKDLDYLVKTLNKLFSNDGDDAYDFLKLIGNYDFDTVYNLFKEENLVIELKSKIKEQYYIPNSIKLVNQGSYRFADIIANKNLFKDENAILSLLENILFNEKVLLKISEGQVDFNNLKIKVNNWKKLSNPKYARKNINIEITSDINSRFEFPEWCKNSEEKVSYFLGALLRSALSSRLDYLSNKSNIDNRIGYMGISNTRHIKKISLNHFRDNINNNELPITNEVMELLFSLLWYPGLYIPIDRPNYFGDTAKIKREIINLLNERELLYCVNSDLPGYVYKLKKVVNKKSKINILSVQSLFPNAEDFSKVFPNYISKNFRRQHRQHIAEVIELIKSYLKVQMKEKINVDIIVFPEISINPEDIDLIEQLSDETGAHIFAGLTYSYLDENQETFKNEALWLLRDESRTGRNFVKLIQGKRYPTNPEMKMNVKNSKLNQVIIEFNFDDVKYRVAGAICYDATDINLASDLRHKSDLFIISAYNKDISTFDNMVAALNYHMYQPVILVNCGYNGGSMIQAPYKGHEKLLSSVHGGKQVALSLAEFSISDFKDRGVSKNLEKDIKTSPAGFLGRQ
ncbi:reverse transcriptase domain-containing protein [Lysinibacillus fusiformis]|uniref:reverse transcriptase domain-containing protein n=1 Tax=Lysinibacillus fusiformis TaxID=28031 RepID=UPI00263A48AE|nr:reverse transcriptase domain-containing protein [Lysinibacillus sphaericus]MDN4970947.1 reverse transcriptase domain-containing protein [Lysinibacillus fusiformis]